MDTSVNLQDPFSYSIYLIIILIILALGISIYILIMVIKKESTVPKNIEIKKIDKKDITYLKKVYINRLNELENKLKNNKISLRSAYQSMSILIRYFVYEVTGIKVQNYTLKEIKKLNMPILYELIQEYYSPEFAKRSLGNVQNSIERTRKAIEKWN